MLQVERERRAVVAEGLRHHVQHPARSGLGRRRVGLAQQQRELVAAQARQHVVLAQAALDALGHVDQHAVAGLLAQACR